MNVNVKSGDTEETDRVDEDSRGEAETDNFVEISVDREDENIRVSDTGEDEKNNTVDDDCGDVDSIRVDDSFVDLNVRRGDIVDIGRVDGDSNDREVDIDNSVEISVDRKGENARDDDTEEDEKNNTVDDGWGDVDSIRVDDSFVDVNVRRGDAEDIGPVDGDSKGREEEVDIENSVDISVDREDENVRDEDDTVDDGWVDFDSIRVDNSDVCFVISVGTEDIDWVDEDSIDSEEDVDIDNSVEISVDCEDENIGIEEIEEDEEGDTENSGNDDDSVAGDTVSLDESEEIGNGEENIVVVEDDNDGKDGIVDEIGFEDPSTDVDGKYELPVKGDEVDKIVKGVDDAFLMSRSILKIKKTFFKVSKAKPQVVTTCSL